MLWLKGFFFYLPRRKVKKKKNIEKQKEEPNL
jgi:hypothetical protein